jgi:hypothetical protein
MSAKKINSSLTQQCNAKGEIRNFEIYNSKFMKVKMHDLFGKKSYHINLTMLEPWPVHHRRIAWRWLLAFIYFAATTIAFFIYQYQHASNNTASALLPFIIIFLLLTLVSLLFLLYQSPNVTEFRSRYGSCPLISLLQNKPDQKSFSEFTKEVKTRILAASQNVTFDKKQMLSLELQELRRLMDTGVLSQHQYEQAKNRVLKMHI